ncbi:MAG: alpha/beta fold hydrolase [Acidimicrobiia bacterium]|nr:alpha/beta fold hydrolase [Acidimicrobiia bacterium]
MPAGAPLVLVHGGAHGAWCWEPTLPFLGARALAVDLPGRGGTPGDLATLTVGGCAASVLADADAAGLDRFVLVGHSLAGLTVPEVAALAPERVLHLVFVSCAIPPEGGALVDTLPASLRRLSRRAARRLGRRPAGFGSQLPRPVARRMFCDDMDEAQSRFVLERLGPDSLGLVTEPVSRRRLPTSVPKTYVLLRRDRSLGWSRQHAMVANLVASPGGPVRLRWLDAGHDVMVSRPRALAALLDEVAREAAGASGA